MAKPKYTGPDYRRGLTIEGKTYDPKSWTAKQIADHCKREPRLKQYFGAAKKIPSAEEE